MLKGPASILFGRGSTGGVVEQDSKLPKLGSFGAGTLTFGSDLTRRVTVDVNEPLPELGQGAALRLNAMAHDSHVAGRDVARNDRFGLAPSLALGLGTPTRLTFTYLHFSEYDVPDYGLPWINSALAGSPTGRARPAPLSLTDSNYYGFRNGNYLRNNVDVPTVKIEHDISPDVTISDQLRHAQLSAQLRHHRAAAFHRRQRKRQRQQRHAGADRAWNAARLAQRVAEPARREFSGNLSGQPARSHCAIPHLFRRSHLPHRHRGVAGNIRPGPAHDHRPISARPRCCFRTRATRTTPSPTFHRAPRPRHTHKPSTHSIRSSWTSTGS